VWKVTSKARKKLSDAQAALREFEAFDLPEREVTTQEILTTAHTYKRSAYDAAYLALAKSEQIPLVTADKHLYDAVKDKNPAWFSGWRIISSPCDMTEVTHKGSRSGAGAGIQSNSCSIQILPIPIASFDQL